MLKNRRKKRSREQWENWRATWREHKSIAEAKEKLEDKKVRGVLRLVFEIIVTLAFAALVGIAMFQSVTMQESSMEPTISVGDRYFMNRVIYRVSSPKRGDVIVFRTNASDDAALHIRRVIGLPGETVQIVDGQILINGETYKEGRDFPVISNPGMASSPVTLESGEYFVLGDNRNNSEDSRYGSIGKVNKKYITGKLWFKLFPVKSIGFFE
ncbi:MAG: signal peptidase I [Blautia sp.]